jgi:hypothetical protein
MWGTTGEKSSVGMESMWMHVVTHSYGALNHFVVAGSPEAMIRGSG